eukprot:3063930-Rhodomonas_salina.1
MHLGRRQTRAHRTAVTGGPPMYEARHGQCTNRDTANLDWGTANIDRDTANIARLRQCSAPARF